MNATNTGDRPPVSATGTGNSTTIARRLLRAAADARATRQWTSAFETCVGLSRGGHAALFDEETAHWTCQQLMRQCLPLVARHVAVDWLRVHSGGNATLTAMARMTPEGHAAARRLVDDLRDVEHASVAATTSFWQRAAYQTTLWFELFGAFDDATRAPSCERWDVADSHCANVVQRDAARILRRHALPDPTAVREARDALRLMHVSARGWMSVVIRGWLDVLEQ